MIWARAICFNEDHHLTSNTFPRGVVQCHFSFPVANITDDSKDSQTVIVAAGVSAGVVFVAVIVITPGGVYIWYRKKIRPDGKTVMINYLAL